MPNVVRHIVGINPGAEGSDRRFEVPQPGESVLLVRPVEMTHGFYQLDPDSGEVRHSSGSRTPKGWHRSQQGGAVIAPGEHHPHEDCMPFSGDAWHVGGGFSSAGPIVCHLTHGDRNDPSSEMGPDDYTANSGGAIASLLWYDWEYIPPGAGPNIKKLVNPRAHNSIASFMWKGVDDSDKFDTVTRNTAGFTGSAAPILSAVRAGHEGHASEDNYETASFHSYQADSSTHAVYQWDLYGNATDGINVAKLHGRTLVSTDGTIQVSHSGVVKCQIDATSTGYTIGSTGTAAMTFNTSGDIIFNSTTANDATSTSTGANTGAAKFLGGVYISTQLEIEDHLFVNWSYTASDERLKTNIAPFKNATKMVSKLRGVEFNWGEESKYADKPDYGVIAQDVQKVLPHAVKEKNGMLTVEYSKLTPLLIEAVKELTERVEYLENKDKTSF